MKKLNQTKLNQVGMRKRLSVLVQALLVLGLLVGGISKSVAQTVPGVMGNQPVATPQPLKEWTFLVFINADNNLYPFAYTNLAQMEKVGSNNNMNVVVQFDPEPKNLQTTRLYITKNQNSVNGKVTSPVLQSLGETDMGSPQVLADFLSWGVKNFPAKKYAVIIWNHGNSWQGISYDDNPRTFLSMPALRKGLEVMNLAIAQQRGVRGQRVAQMIDVLNFDACLMSALEVAYELKDTAKYLVGSQFLEPGAGENYTGFLTPLLAKPNMEARELSETMVYQYALNYQDSNDDINYAAIDLSKVQAFTSQLDQVSRVMNASASKGMIRAAFGKQSFDLVTGLNLAKKASVQDTNAASALDQLIQSYGYPLEGVFRNKVSRNEAVDTVGQVYRLNPGTVYYRYALNGQWSKAELQVNAMGEYQFRFPQGQPKQYFVVNKSEIKNIGSRSGMQESMQNRTGVVQSREGLSTYLRAGNDPIVFHNQFPATSPLVADAYTRATRGAHGMTLFSLAGLFYTNTPGAQALGGNLLTSYKQLLFSSQGAPNWTSFFQ